MASSDERGLKRFSGDDADDAGKQLRKFRNWAEAKMVTMKDLSDKQKGPWIYTLLDGRALEAVEHLTLTDLVKEDGAATLWNLLTARFPEKESEDQMGEALGEVFALCAKDGETMQQWSSRVHEVFQKCVRKAKVQFPSAAQGWITLNCAGLSEEQKAIVKAKTQGKLEIEVVTAALRSCFPQYKASANRARRPVNTYLVDPDLAAGPEDTVEETDDFKDVEAFLADHGFKRGQGRSRGVPGGGGGSRGFGCHVEGTTQRDQQVAAEARLRQERRAGQEKFPGRNRGAQEENQMQPMSPFWSLGPGMQG